MHSAIYCPPIHRGFGFSILENIIMFREHCRCPTWKDLISEWQMSSVDGTPRSAATSEWPAKCDWLEGWLVALRKSAHEKLELEETGVPVRSLHTQACMGKFSRERNTDALRWQFG